MINKHFRAYREIVTKINAKNMELIRLKEDWYNLTGSRLSDMPKGGKPMDMADQLHYITEKEKELISLLNYKKELRRIHEQEIEKISDVNKQTILKLFYLDFCELKRIGQCIGKSLSHTQTLKREAVEEFLKTVI